MNRRSISDATLREFLLGNVEEDERQRIEEVFISDALMRDRVLGLEQELVEDYLEDSLNLTDKERFLAQYAATPTQRQQLRITKSIKDWALTESKATVATPTPGSSWSRLFGRLRLRPIFVIPIVAAAFIALVFAGIWLSRKLEQRNDLLALEHEIAQLNSTSNSEQALTSLTLRPISVRSSEPQAELVTRGPAKVVELRLLWIQSEHYQRYQAVVKRAGVAQSFTIRDLQADSDGRLIRIRLPIHILHDGSYELELSGVVSNGSPSQTEEYHFTVTANSNS